MTDDDRQLAVQAARVLGLALDPDHLDGVAAHLALLRQHVARVMAVPLPPDIESAPVFRP
ncbi:DUF4089 domain-containing protein [Lichenicola sp.]|uniref:DUF4089 domain-containing protein n=1 Tax=Lichenicola sp. TaxID=2804529 RepID=UPI003AFF7032